MTFVLTSAMTIASPLTRSLAGLWSLIANASSKKFILLLFLARSGFDPFLLFRRTTSPGSGLSMWRRRSFPSTTVIGDGFSLRIFLSENESLVGTADRGALLGFESRPAMAGVSGRLMPASRWVVSCVGEGLSISTFLGFPSQSSGKRRLLPAFKSDVLGEGPAKTGRQEG